MCTRAVTGSYMSERSVSFVSATWQTSGKSLVVRRLIVVAHSGANVREWWSLIITIIIMLITRRAVKLTRGKHWVMSMFTKQEVEEYDFFISLLSPYSDSLMMNHACKTCIVYKHRSQCGYWLLNWNSDNWNRKPG